MDVYHLCGTDFAISPNGGLATVTDAEEGQQRVLRRLLTNQGNYFWHLAYGAGLPSFLGRPIVNKQIEGTIRQQMRLEQAVVQSPPPNITLTTDTIGDVVANIRYVDAKTDLTSVLTVPLTG